MSKIVLIGDSITAYMPYIFKGSIGNIDDEELFDKRYSNDGIHPNELGYSVIAEEINKKIKNKFTKKINTVF